MEPRTERVGIRLSPSLKERAEAAARAEERTLSQWIERLIRETVEGKKQ